MNQTSTRWVAVLLLGGFLAAAGCASSSDVQRLQMQISGMEKKHRSLEASVAKLRDALEKDRQQQKAITEMRDLFAGQDAEFYALKSQLQNLQGAYEESEYRIQRRLQSLEEKLARLDEKIARQAETLNVYDKRLSRMENFMGMEPSARFEALAEAKFPEKPELENLSADQLYAAAKQAYDNGDFQSALQGFELFSEKFPDSDNADNARFWIGEIYFAEKWYERAILEYEKVIKNFPDGNKVAGAYLKQGLSFEKLGEKANARLILNQLIEKFPESNEASIARKKLATMG